MINGVVPLYKESGYSSFYYVNQLKIIYQQKKVGHIGTLDPLVSGVLPICLGNATKLVASMMQQKKAYACTILIGQATETEDLAGEVITTKAVNPQLNVAKVDAVLETFKGKNYQVPPFFSAVRYHGKHLYEYARQDIFIKKPKRLFEIAEIFRTSPVRELAGANCEFEFTVVCTKGTYIRTLCTQIGQKLGYPAVMKKLTRIASGGFDLAQAIPLAKLKDTARPQELVITLEEILHDLPSKELNEAEFKKVKNGAPLILKQSQDQLALKYQERIIAIYRQNEDCYRAETMFLDNVNENNKNKG